MFIWMNVFYMHLFLFNWSSPAFKHDFNNLNKTTGKLKFFECIPVLI